MTPSYKYYRSDGRNVLYSTRGVPEVCIAEANTAIWATHIATALNYWATATAADPLSVACPVIRCARPVRRQCLAVGSQGGMDGPPHEERVSLAQTTALASLKV